MKFNAEQFYVETGALSEIATLHRILFAGDVWLLRQEEVEKFLVVLKQLEKDIRKNYSDKHDIIDDGLEAIGRYEENENS